MSGQTLIQFTRRHHGDSVLSPRNHTARHREWLSVHSLLLLNRPNHEEEY